MAGFLARWHTHPIGGRLVEQSRRSWPWPGRRLVWANLAGVAILGTTPTIAPAAQPIPFGAPLPESSSPHESRGEVGREDAAGPARDAAAAVPSPPAQSRLGVGIAPRPEPDFFAPLDRPSPSYGVYVLGDNLATFDQVRQISDSATFTTYRGQTAITAGRFGQLFEARARVQELARLGLRAEIAPQPSRPESQPSRSAASVSRSLMASTAPAASLGPVTPATPAHFPPVNPALPPSPAPERPALVSVVSVAPDAPPARTPSALALAPDPRPAELPPDPASGWELPWVGSGATLVPAANIPTTTQENASGNVSENISPNISPSAMPGNVLSGNVASPRAGNASDALPANLAPTWGSDVTPRPTQPEPVAPPSVAIAPRQPYFLVIPGSPDDLLKLVDRLLAAGVAVQNITATAEEFGPQLRIGPFADLALASQWRDSLRRSQVRSAIYHNGWLLDAP